MRLVLLQKIQGFSCIKSSGSMILPVRASGVFVHVKYLKQEFRELRSCMQHQSREVFIRR